jgi:hypothetical protein
MKCAACSCTRSGRCAGRGRGVAGVAGARGEAGVWRGCGRGGQLTRAPHPMLAYSLLPLRVGQCCCYMPCP